MAGSQAAEEFEMEDAAEDPLMGVPPEFPVDAPTSALPKGSLDPVYEAKARVLNTAIQEIGMGKYQWQLFVVIGYVPDLSTGRIWPDYDKVRLGFRQFMAFGHVVDSTACGTRVQPTKGTASDTFSKRWAARRCNVLGTTSFYCFDPRVDPSQGFGCDIFGRKLAFNLTIGITAVFGLLSAISPTFAVLEWFAALWSIGVGGNLPVDSAIFLEFLPGSHQYLLTVLSIFWALAQVIATLVAWPLLGNAHYTCFDTSKPCSRNDNMGWRYFMVLMGGLAMVMFVLRFRYFTLFESPKFLMGHGRDAEAVRVVHAVARINGRTSNLTLEYLQSFNEQGQQETTTSAAVRRKLQAIDLSHLHALFANRQLAWSTSLIMLVWAFLGLGFPLYNAFLPYIQEARGVDFGDGSTYVTYRNLLIIAMLGVPGALLGGVLVEVPRLGRKGALTLATCMTGFFLFASTTAATSNALLFWNCGFAFMSNVTYAVL